MRLIDADELLKHEHEADRMGTMLVVGKGYILNAPSIEIVHWRDCRYWNSEYGLHYCDYDCAGLPINGDTIGVTLNTNEDDFCSRGRKYE